jgi:hypothetical protein
VGSQLPIRREAVAGAGKAQHEIDAFGAPNLDEFLFLEMPENGLDDRVREFQFPLQRAGAADAFEIEPPRDQVHHQ